jgi:hypothetical protein
VCGAQHPKLSPRPPRRGWSRKPGTDEIRVITAYQPASRTAARRRCSATTRTSELSAISSQRAGNVDTPLAHGTSTNAIAKAGSAAGTAGGRAMTAAGVADSVQSGQRHDGADTAMNRPLNASTRSRTPAEPAATAGWRQSPRRSWPQTGGDPRSPTAAVRTPTSMGRDQWREGSPPSSPGVPTRRPRSSTRRHCQTGAWRSPARSPASPLSAATMASGGGGRRDPASTGTTSLTAPTTPWATNTPALRAHHRPTTCAVQTQCRRSVATPAMCG